MKPFLSSTSHHWISSLQRWGRLPITSLPPRVPGNWAKVSRESTKLSWRVQHGPMMCQLVQWQTNNQEPKWPDWERMEKPCKGACFTWSKHSSSTSEDRDHEKPTLAPTKAMTRNPPVGEICSSSRETWLNLLSFWSSNLCSQGADPWNLACLTWNQWTRGGIMQKWKVSMEHHAIQVPSSGFIWFQCLRFFEQYREQLILQMKMEPPTIRYSMIGSKLRNQAEGRLRSSKAWTWGLL